MLRRLAILLLCIAALPTLAQPFRRHVRTSAAAPVTAEQQSLWNRYQQAIFDSAVYQFWNLRPLRPLTPDDHGEVLVATLTSENYPVGQPVEHNGYIWVTGVPEVQDICRAFHGDVQLRLRELIGLPPDEDISHAVVMRVSVSDVFRPSPWGETNTRWPCGITPGGGAPTADCGNAFPSDATPAHVSWIANAAFSLHTVPDGYPWTHLGYTYNWAPNGERYGASEYVIRKDAVHPVVVVSNVSPESYCAPVPQ